MKIRTGAVGESDRFEAPVSKLNHSPKMRFRILLLFSVVGSLALGNTIGVSRMKTHPRVIRAFSNDLFSEVRASRSLIDLFLNEGTPTHQLSETQLAYDEKYSIQNPMEEGADGSVTMSFLIHGCSGVFTDQNDIVYIWRLSSPRILQLTSQTKETTTLVLDQEHLEGLVGYGRGQKPVEASQVNAPH